MLKTSNCRTWVDLHVKDQNSVSSIFLSWLVQLLKLNMAHVFVTAVHVILELPVMCFGDLTPVQHSKLHDSTSYSGSCNLIMWAPLSNYHTYRLSLHHQISKESLFKSYSTIIIQIPLESLHTYLLHTHFYYACNYGLWLFFIIFSIGMLILTNYMYKFTRLCNQFASFVDTACII